MTALAYLLIHHLVEHLSSKLLMFSSHISHFHNVFCHQLIGKEVYDWFQIGRSSRGLNTMPVR